MRCCPDNVTLVTRGEASALAETNRDTLITYGFALLIVFLVLIAQFEGITSALVIMAIVPFGLAAAVCALFLTGTSLNIYSQVGAGDAHWPDRQERYSTGRICGSAP
jgi:multidrug efflux pump subunit AcrB